MEERHLELIVAICEERGFTAAAQRLHIAQPAVSQQVRVMERQLGVDLFTRTARGATPTEACLRLLPRARTALAALADARAVARCLGDDGVIGRVRLGAALGTERRALTQLLRTHAEQHPNVEVSLHRDGSQGLLDRLTAGELDLALVASSADRLPTGLRARWLPPTEVVCAVPAGHRLAGATAVPLGAVLAQPLVSLPRSAGIRPGLERAAVALAADLRIAYEANDIDIVLDLVAAGLGVALVPGSAPAGRDDVMSVRLEGSPLTHHAAVAWPARAPDRPVVATLRELVVTVLGGDAG